MCTENVINDEDHFVKLCRVDHFQDQNIISSHQKGEFLNYTVNSIIFNRVFRE